MTLALLPCPYCGGAPRQYDKFPGARTTWCSNQPVNCSNRSMYTPEEWNRRAPATQGDQLDAKRYRFVRDLAWYVDRGASVYNINNADSIWRSERGSVDADEVEAAIDRVRLGLEPEEDIEHA